MRAGGSSLEVRGLENVGRKQFDLFFHPQQPKYVFSNKAYKYIYLYIYIYKCLSVIMLFQLLLNCSQ